jgi:Fe-S-cluster containining protein
MSEDLFKNWEKRSQERTKAYKTYLKRVQVKSAVDKLPDLHEEAFERVDCLTCGNCCKGYSPRFKTPDIKRISKVVGLREGVFIEKYLKLDAEGDYVLQQAPCPFLGGDNHCSIYEDRPSDCRRFPYTDEDVFVKRTALTLKNTSFCPAAYYVLERLMAVNP